LLAVDLVPHCPFILREHQPPHGIGGRLVLVAATLEDAKATGHLLDQGGIEVEDHFAGDRSVRRLSVRVVILCENLSTDSPSLNVVGEGGDPE
jgi:hypothetical protein